MKKYDYHIVFRQQMWMTDDSEFDHIVENLQGVLKLNA